MHIPDNLLATQTVVVTDLLGAAGFGYALRRIQRGDQQGMTVLMGMMAAFLFAAQMVTFPVGPGVSGHLLGGVLAAVVLGPWAGAVVIGAVLLVQCLLFQDGGFTAIGANFINMGLIGCVGGYAIYAPIRRTLKGPRGIIIGAMVAAWFSVILASGAFALELASGGRGGGFGRILGWMTLVHAAIGLGEALITGLVLRFVLLTQPGLIPELDAEAPSHGQRLGQLALGGLAVALALAIFAAPFASSWPDGLEFTLEKLGTGPSNAAAFLKAPFPDYGEHLHLPGIGDARVIVAAVGVLGTLAVFGLAFGLARVFGRMAPALRKPAQEKVGAHEV